MLAHGDQLCWFAAVSSQWHYSIGRLRKHDLVYARSDLLHRRQPTCKPHCKQHESHTHLTASFTRKPG